MAQALGRKFLSKTDMHLYPKKGKYFMGLDLSRVNNIVWDSIHPVYKNVSITALCDSKINMHEMSVPTDMKISKYYDKERVEINETLKSSLLNYSKIIGKKLEDIQSHPSYYYKSLEKQKRLGVAGGINLSLIAIFNPLLIDGAPFFIEKFHIFV